MKQSLASQLFVINDDGTLQTRYCQDCGVTKETCKCKGQQHNAYLEHLMRVGGGSIEPSLGLLRPELCFNCAAASRKLCICHPQLVGEMPSSNRDLITLYMRAFSLGETDLSLAANERLADYYNGKCGTDALKAAGWSLDELQQVIAQRVGCKSPEVLFPLENLLYVQDWFFVPWTTKDMHSCHAMALNVATGEMDGISFRFGAPEFMWLCSRGGRPIGEVRVKVEEIVHRAASSRVLGKAVNTPRTFETELTAWRYASLLREAEAMGYFHFKIVDISE